jgi:hypothetical protein
LTPFIRQVNGCLQERRADAHALELIADRHAYFAHMTAARAIGKSMNI